MGTVLSVFRAAPGAPIGTTRELGGADGTTGIDKDMVSQTGAGDTQTATQNTEQQPQQKPKESNCFLDGDAANWEQWVPTRIKESRLTPEERAKFQGHVDLIFDEKTIMGRRIVFDPDDLAEVMVKVKVHLKSEPMLIEDVPFGVNVAGDLHGQLYDLNRIFRSEERDGKPGWENMRYVFLGNYVDRGRQSIEIVMALFCLKMLYPDRIFLLRGNHEFVTVNQEEGFLRDFYDRYEDEDLAILLYKITNETFCYLSVAAIVGNDYLCVHAGISPAGFTRQQLRGMSKPVCKSEEDVLIHDILNSDPAMGLGGYAYNDDRKTSFFYGLSAVCNALHSMQVKVIIRGHSQLNEGWECLWHLVYSIFSATAADLWGKHNDGAIAAIDEQGKIGIHILRVNPERVDWEKMLRAEEAPGHVEKTDGKAIVKTTPMKN